MLSIIADAMLTAVRNDRWNAPDHWRNESAPRSNAQRKREEAEWRHRAYRDTGIR